MAIPNRHLDDSIAFALETETVVTKAQKKAAWHKVRERAAQQVMLAPYAIAPATRRPALSLWARMTGAAQRALSFTVTDSSVYDRAAVRRQAMHRYNPPGNRVSFSSQVIFFYHPGTLIRVGLF